MNTDQEAEGRRIFTRFNLVLFIATTNPPTQTPTRSLFRGNLNFRRRMLGACLACRSPGTWGRRGIEFGNWNPYL
jgi:hypothetical protein